MKIENLNIDDLDKKELNFCNQGVYLITGGSGGIGLETAKYFVTKNNKVNLALIGRTKLPSRTTWENIIIQKEDSKLCKIISSIMEMERNGAKIECFNIDISSENQTKAVINTLREKYGKINGVVHCAGIAGDGYLVLKEKEDIKDGLLAKVQGTWIIHNLLKNDNLDFFVMFSSIASMLGGLGQGYYAAANAYMDSFEAYSNKMGMKTKTINWAGWRDVGMAKDYNVNVDTIFKIMDTTKAINAFESILNYNISRVIIGELNYENEMFSSEKKLLNCFSEGINLQISESIQKKKIMSKDKESNELIFQQSRSYSEIESLISGVWKDVLGYDEISINDNFFEIGGDSIIVTKLQSELEKIFTNMIKITDIFAYPTIEKLAKYIKENYFKDSENNDTGYVENIEFENNILNIFDEIEKGNISVDKAMQYFNSMEV